MLWHSLKYVNERETLHVYCILTKKNIMEYTNVSAYLSVELF